MKDLKIYIIESIKPPRLSAKNKELWSGPQFIKEEVMKWLKKNCRVEGKVGIVDGKINVKGDVKVNGYVKEFTYPFGEVTGFFSCSDCESLTSLEGAPEEVGNNFTCSFCNNLTSLEGAPEEVGGDFYCRTCGKQFTEDDVRKVCKVNGFVCVKY